MDLPLVSRILLYTIVGIFGLLCILTLVWQIKVLLGKSMKNPDGSNDDWHEQKLFYGIALADISIAIPVTFIGIVLIFFGLRIGYYLTGLGAFWFLWANTMTTATSLRFEKLRMSINWFMVFPFGAIIGLAYIAWTLVHFETIFSL